MDVERLLVTRMVVAGSMEAVLARSIEPEHFVQRQRDDDSKIPLPGEVYEWMKTHLATHKSVPSKDLTVAVFPEFEFYDTGDAIESVVDQMVNQVKRRLLIEKLRDAAKIADDPSRINEAEEHMYAIASELAQAVPSTKVSRYSDARTRLSHHQAVSAEDLGMGISMVLEDLDALTFGLHPHELMIWQGFLNIGKSSIAMAQCAKAYLEQGATPLIFSLEMEGDKLQQRFDSMIGKISYDAMKRMELGDEDYDKWAKVAERAHDCRFEKDILVLNELSNVTPEKVFVEVEKWKPDFTVVDTIDEIRAPARFKALWEQQAYAARQLKEIARLTKRPMVGIAQSGRDAAEEGALIKNIAGSIDIARKADVVIGLHATPQMKKIKQMEVRALKFRDNDGVGTTWKYRWDIGAMEYRPWRESDSYAEPGRQPGPPNTAVPSGAFDPPGGHDGVPAA